MSKERIAVIISEIQYWKEHKLLPEEYCNFLLALYTNGEGIGENEKYKNRSSVRTFLQVVLMVLLLPFSFLVIYFTKFPSVLQLSILILFLSYSFWCFLYYKKKNIRIMHLSLVITLMLILLSTFFIGNLTRNAAIVNTVIFLNFLFWMGLSWKNKWNYLMITAIIGIMFTIIYNVL